MGFNHFIAGGSFTEVLEQYEEALQMGYLATAMMLKELKVVFDNYEGIYSYSSVTGARGAYTSHQANGIIDMKTIHSYGESIVEQYRKLTAEIKSGKGIKSSVEGSEYGKSIEEFVDAVRHGAVGMIQEDGGSRSGIASRSDYRQF